MIATKGVRISCFYSQRDDSLRRELVKHLIVLRRQSLITNWSDYQIEAGADAEKLVLEQLAEADLLLLLLSGDFITSDFYSNDKVKNFLIRRQTGDARVLSIILYSLAPMDQTVFSMLDILPLRVPEKAITDWFDIDEAFYTITQDLHAVIKQCLSKQWVDQGKVLYVSASYEEALAAYEEAIQFDPSYAEAYYEKGLVLSQLQRYTEASKAFEEAFLLGKTLVPSQLQKIQYKSEEVKHSSEVARLLEQISVEYEAAQRGLSGFATLEDKEEVKHSSEVARLLEQISVEYEATQRGLSGFATLEDKHDFITARMEHMGLLHKELQSIAGDFAIELIAETLINLHKDS